MLSLHLSVRKSNILLLKLLFHSSFGLEFETSNLGTLQFWQRPIEGRVWETRERTFPTTKRPKGGEGQDRVSSDVMRLRAPELHGVGAAPVRARDASLAAQKSSYTTSAWKSGYAWMVMSSKLWICLKLALHCRVARRHGQFPSILQTVKRWPDCFYNPVQDVTGWIEWGHWTQLSKLCLSSDEKVVVRFCCLCLEKRDSVTKMITCIPWSKTEDEVLPNSTQISGSLHLLWSVIGEPRDVRIRDGWGGEGEGQARAGRHRRQARIKSLKSLFLLLIGQKIN